MKTRIYLFELSLIHPNQMRYLRTIVCWDPLLFKKICMAQHKLFVDAKIKMDGDERSDVG